MNAHVAPFFDPFVDVTVKMFLSLNVLREKVKDASPPPPKKNETFLLWKIELWFRFGSGLRSGGYFLLAEYTQQFSPATA